MTSFDTVMIIVYGSDWCEDTRRALRHLRRLGLSHRYLNLDEDLDALDRAKALSGGRRRTPIIDVGLGGPPLVEPDNDTLTAALVEVQMLTMEDAEQRLGVQNVGDVERGVRAVAGLTLLALSSAGPRTLRWPLRAAGVVTALTGFAGWCPAYHYARVTSLGGPGDRPNESRRRSWLAPQPGSSADALGSTATEAAPR